MLIIKMPEYEIYFYSGISQVRLVVTDIVTVNDSLSIQLSDNSYLYVI